MFKTIAPLSAIISLRFFGLFLVLPIISAYTMTLKGATTELVGIVIGGYALTQMLFQLPFGILSDKMGRKGTIILGLLLFFIGSIICAIANDILALLLGRLMQGAGAIGAVVTAMISDLVKEEQRSKAMAIMGASIAFSFAFAMFAGPVIGAFTTINVLFYITAAVALFSIYLIVYKVPTPPKVIHAYDDAFNFMPVLKNSNLIRMNITNFLQKGLMTFAFMIIPMVLLDHFQWEITHLYKVYIPAMIFGVLAMAPSVIFAEKKGFFKQILLIGILFFIISYLVIGFTTNEYIFILGVVIFFVGFNMHEPIMQSLTTKFAKVHQRGMVLGIFNSFGYFGTFLGGVLGGIFFNEAKLSQIAIAIAIIGVLWILLIITMPNPKKQQIAYIPMDNLKRDNFQILNQNENIFEWYINENEQLLIVKYNEQNILQDDILQIINSKNN